MWYEQQNGRKESKGREKNPTYLHSRQQLHRQHEDGFEGETTITQVEKILQTRTKQFHDQGIVLSAGSEIKDAGYTFHWRAKKYIWLTDFTE